jgi:hypothetical protein
MTVGPVAPLLAVLASAVASLTGVGDDDAITGSVGRLPPIVFVARERPPGGEPTVIPGLGPHHRTLVTGGRLLVRDPDGALRDLLPAGAMHDVSDPSVSFDGTRVAFAGVVHPDSAWRIWMVGLDGKGLRPLTYTDRRLDLSPLGAAAQRFERYDDFDPTWTSDHLVCFASTRYPMRAQYDDVPVSNLFLVHVDMVRRNVRLRRLTSERNGAEEPTVDVRNSRIVFSRWWFNRHRPSDRDPGGLTQSAAHAEPDSVNLWHAMEMFPLEGVPPRLAAGYAPSRLRSEAYQPAVLADGSLAAVFASNLGLSPSPVATGIQRFTARFDEPERLIGAAVEESPADPYAAGRGLAPPSACSPAALPDGRILFSWDPGARGDFGLYVMDAEGSGIAPVVDLPGTLELDATAVVVRPGLKTYQEQRRLGALPPEQPITDGDDMLGRGRTFRFQCLNLFGGGNVDSPIPDPIPIAEDLRIRFFAMLSRPAQQGGDTAVLVREVPVGPHGEIDESGLPADVPMFEQVVDSKGRIVTSPQSGRMKAAHVAGANVGSPPYVARCVGCHVGHSTLVRDEPVRQPEWFNASTSARVEGTSVAEGSAFRAVVDRATRGPARDVAWIASRGGGEGVRLTWTIPIEIGAVVLYNVRPDEAAGTDLVVTASEVIVRRAGAVVDRRTFAGRLSPDGTRLELSGRAADEIEVRVTAVQGRVEGRDLAALAEVETVARLPGR